MQSINTILTTTTAECPTSQLDGFHLMIGSLAYRVMDYRRLLRCHTCQKPRMGTTTSSSGRYPPRAIYREKLTYPNIASEYGSIRSAGGRASPNVDTQSSRSPIATLLFPPDFARPQADRFSKSVQRFSVSGNHTPVPLEGLLGRTPETPLSIFVTINVYETVSLLHFAR